MRIFVLLPLLIVLGGCSKAPVADSPSESPPPPSEDVKPSADSPKPLISDADVERLFKEAVDRDSIEERDGLYYQTNESEPFSGWVKTMSDSEYYRKGLTQFKDGKPHGPMMVWHENGQKEYEGTYKDGNADGLWTYRHENGQRQSETTFKDGKELSAKYWNSKGEPVDSQKEAQGSESTGESPTPSNESAEPSADTPKPPPAETPAAESPSEEPSETPNSLSDADVERLLKEAVDFDSLEERNDLYYQTNESEPFSGWVKSMRDSGQVQGLAQFKDGELDGLMTRWHENGQKEREATFKDGKMDGLITAWHENGEKWREQTLKDGKKVSEKWWNSKGEEVETMEEASD